MCTTQQYPLLYSTRRQSPSLGSPGPGDAVASVIGSVARAPPLQVGHRRPALGVRRRRQRQLRHHQRPLHPQHPRSGPQSDCLVDDLKKDGRERRSSGPEGRWSTIVALTEAAGPAAGSIQKIAPSVVLNSAVLVHASCSNQPSHDLSLALCSMHSVERELLWGARDRGQGRRLVRRPGTQPCRRRASCRTATPR